MATVIKTPIQTVSDDRRDIVYFSALNFNPSALLTAATIFTGSIATFYPNGVAADEFRLDLPSFSNAAKNVVIKFSAFLQIRLEAPQTSPRNDLLAFGNIPGDTIRFDGVPYDLELLTNDPVVLLRQNNLQNISIARLYARFNLETVNTLTTAFFTLGAGAVHNAELYVKPTVYLER